MSDHHTSDREPIHEYRHACVSADMPHATGRFAAAPSRARAAYVPPSFRRIEVVRTENNPGPGGDAGFGAS